MKKKSTIYKAIKGTKDAKVERSGEFRHNQKDRNAREFEASLATFIIASRFGWDLHAPIAKEFLADSTMLAPEGTNLFSAFQAVHFVEAVLQARKHSLLDRIKGWG